MSLRSVATRLYEAKREKRQPVLEGTFADFFERQKRECQALSRMFRADVQFQVDGHTLIAIFKVAPKDRKAMGTRGWKAISTMAGYINSGHYARGDRDPSYKDAVEAFAADDGDQFRLEITYEEGAGEAKRFPLGGMARATVDEATTDKGLSDAAKKVAGFADSTMSRDLGMLAVSEFRPQLRGNALRVCFSGRYKDFTGFASINPDYDYEPGPASGVYTVSGLRAEKAGLAKLRKVLYDHLSRAFNRSSDITIDPVVVVTVGKYPRNDLADIVFTAIFGDRYTLPTAPERPDASHATVDEATNKDLELIKLLKKHLEHYNMFYLSSIGPRMTSTTKFPSAVLKFCPDDKYTDDQFEREAWTLLKNALKAERVAVYDTERGWTTERGRDQKWHRFFTVEIFNVVMPGAPERPTGSHATVDEAHAEKSTWYYPGFCADERNELQKETNSTRVQVTGNNPFLSWHFHYATQDEMHYAFLRLLKYVQGFHRHHSQETTHVRCLGAARGTESSLENSIEFQFLADPEDARPQHPEHPQASHAAVDETIAPSDATVYGSILAPHHFTWDGRLFKRFAYTETSVHYTGMLPNGSDVDLIFLFKGPTTHPSADVKADIDAVYQGTTKVSLRQGQDVRQAAMLALDRLIKGAASDEPERPTGSRATTDESRQVPLAARLYEAKAEKRRLVKSSSK